MGKTMFFRPHHVWAWHADLSIQADIILQCIKLIARPHDNAPLLIVIQPPSPLLACHRPCIASQFELLDGDQWLGLNPSLYNLHQNLRLNNLKLASNISNIFPTKWISCICVILGIYVCATISFCFHLEIRFKSFGVWLDTLSSTKDISWTIH